MSAAETPPLCPKCGSARTARVRRASLLQRFLLHRFGLFPWECSGCRTTFLSKNRGKFKRRRTTGTVHIPPI